MFEKSSRDYRKLRENMECKREREREKLFLSIDEPGRFHRKWFGLISSLVAFLLSHVVFLRSFHKAYLHSSHPLNWRKQPPTFHLWFSLIFIPFNPQDRQMIVFSISLFISPHNLWIIFQHFTTSALSEWIASRSNRLFSRRKPDNILLDEQIFECSTYYLTTLKTAIPSDPTGTCEMVN